MLTRGNKYNRSAHNFYQIFFFENLKSRTCIDKTTTTLFPTLNFSLEFLLCNSELFIIYLLLIGAAGDVLYYLFNRTALKIEQYSAWGSTINKYCNLFTLSIFLFHHITFYKSFLLYSNLHIVALTGFLFSIIC